MIGGMDANSALQSLAMEDEAPPRRGFAFVTAWRTPRAQDPKPKLRKYDSPSTERISPAGFCSGFVICIGNFLRLVYRLCWQLRSMKT